jgi:hypothetical protein
MVQKKENFFTDNPDILFHLNRRWDWDNLFNWLGKDERDAVGATSMEEFRQTWLEAVTAGKRPPRGRRRAGIGKEW